MPERAPLLTPALLLQAYRAGVFPMSEHRDDPEVFWVNPRKRGVLPINGFHISRSLARTLRRGHFTATLDTCFLDVVRGCADRPETWINDTIFDLYAQLHDSGDAHSFEVWQEDQLVGGVYGVSMGAAFFGESMFSTATDASKVALAFAIDHLKSNGFKLFDTQFLTDHLASLGAIEIPRDRYHEMLETALKRHASTGPKGPLGGSYDLVQRNAQTS